MSKSKKPAKQAAPKLASVTFNIKQLKLNGDEPKVFGIDVVKKGNKLVGECDPESAKALIDAGRAE